MKLCVVGPSDSGKTSWFSPFQGVLPVSGIASVTREKHFSAHLIKPSTQVVFIDQWTSDSLWGKTQRKCFREAFRSFPRKTRKQANVSINLAFI